MIIWSCALFRGLVHLCFHPAALTKNLSFWFYFFCFCNCACLFMCGTPVCSLSARMNICVCVCVWEAQASYERPGSWALWRGGADTELRHTYSSLWSREFIKIAHTASSVAPEPQPVFLAKQTGSESDLTTRWCRSAGTNAKKTMIKKKYLKIEKLLPAICLLR